MVTLPKNAVILAKNNHSTVQAFAMQSKKFNFFGVQYHPEFTVDDMVYLLHNIAKKLIEEKTFNSEEEIDKYALKLENKNSLPESVTNYSLHTQEVKRWLDHI